MDVLFQVVVPRVIEAVGLERHDGPYKWDGNDSGEEASAYREAFGEVIAALTAANGYSGPTILNGPTLIGTSTGNLSGALPVLKLTGANGAAASSSGFTLNGAALVLDDSTVVNNNRIGNVPVTLNVGLLQLNVAASAGPTTQSYGNLGLASGSNVVSFVAPTINSGATLASTGGIVRSPGALVAFTGPNLGATPGANVGTVTFATAPALVGGGGAGSPTVSIIPYAVAATAWTHRLACPTFKGAATLAAMRAFRSAYLLKAPEFIPVPE